MSLTVKHLNGDSSFLLTFAPLLQSPSSASKAGVFSILVDPWLSGPTFIYHPKFLLSKLALPACIESLSHIPEPNVVLISQEKPDHCHEDSLRQLDPDSKLTTILAEPAAAKKIRAMKHFKPSCVVALPAYSDRKPESIIRFFIPPLTPGGVPGEATIAFLPAKFDLTGLHNAIGITYRSPTASYFNPDYSADPPFPLSSCPTSDLGSRSNSLTPIVPDSPLCPVANNASSINSTASTLASYQHSQTSPPLSFSSASSIAPSVHPHRTGKTLSLIYSPHGVPSSLIRPYASSHLVSTAALPLTLLLHSFDRVQNPWWLGGNISAGLPGGADIARTLMAKCWVGAHDEEKENSGVSIKKIVTRKFPRKEVVEMVGSRTRVEQLGVGEELVLRA